MEWTHSRMSCMGTKTNVVSVSYKEKQRNMWR